MKMYNNLKHFVACILVISALFSPLSFLITEATEGYQNLTGSYNCYAYAINRVDELDNQVRFYNNTQNGRLYQPGDISKDIYNTFGFDPNISYETMLSLIKCNVISDLYAMGHADVSTTMNIYAEVNGETKRQSLENLAKFAPRAASAFAFLCLILAHLECPAIHNSFFSYTFLIKS